MSDIKFLGQHLTTDEYDELALSLIRKNWRDCELELYSTKWFDYRFMHPTAATYCYAHFYIIAFKACFKKNFDASRAASLQVFKSSNVFTLDKPTISGLWRGRQAADALGVPYDVYCSLAFNHLMTYWKSKHMPRPTHLYGAQTIDAVRTRWQELQTAALYYSTHSAFHNGNYVDSPAQDDHRKWLIAQALKRPNPEPVYERFVGEHLLAASFVKAA